MGSSTDDRPTPIRAKGKALDRSEGEIIELAEIREPDIQAARDDWKEKTTPKYRGLIDAEKEEE